MAGKDSMSEPMLERHLTVNELAEAWGLHPDTVRSLFIDRPGVLKNWTFQASNKASVYQHPNSGVGCTTGLPCTDEVKSSS